MSFNERYPFLYAIIETSASNVASLIDRGADVNTSDSLSRTALMYSVKHDRESVLCLLIDRGADVNICDTLGRTALMYSVIHDRESIAALLIDRGADVNTCDTLGRTALIYGVIHNRENIVAVLIDKNADVSTSDSLGRTALVYGVIHNRECMVALVIDKNADVSMSDSEGITALMHGVIHNRESMVALLIDCDADVNTSDSEGRTALIYSVIYNRKIMIDLLIDGGADINTCDSLGRTALMYGVIHNRKIMVDLLIDRGADVNTCDSLGRTALIYSVIHDRESIVASLIDRGADVNTSDSQGRTALIYGVMLDRESIVCLLIDRVAGVNTSDSEGITALMYGVILDRESIVALLIDGGADVNTSDNEGITALMYGVIHNSDSKVALLIDRGSDVNTSDSQGRTALMYGVIDNRESTVALLIARGADVNLTDNEGKTALFYGVSDENIVRALIEQGNADIDKKDQYGRSSLFYAFTKYPFKSARYLIGKGSDLQLKDNGNLSILSFYVEHCIDVHPFLKVNPNICTELNVFQEHGEKQKAIFEALINLMLCTTLKLKCGFYSWNILTDTALNLAKKYVSSTNLKKKKIIQNILKISNKNEGLTNKNYQRILELLFKLGANPCYADSDGNTVLHYATCLPIADVSQDIVMKICHQLKGLGVTFNAKNHQNETPLLYCLSNKKWITSIQNSHKIKILVDVCKFLLAHGASVEGTTRSEKSIFHFLLELFQQGLLLSECATRKDVLSELLKLLELFSSPKVAIGVAVNRRDINLNSPLHMWASLRFELTLDNDGSDDQNRFEKELLKKVLRHLMDCGAQLDDKNRNGETPLHLCRTWTAVKLLIEAGAQPNVVDSVGRTPLLVASKNIKSKDAELFYSDVQEEPKAFWKTAIESNLDPWTVDKNGESVLSVLIKLQAFVLTKALIELACEENYIQSDTIAVSLLSAICRDRATRTQWKSILVEEILKSRKFPIRYENNKDTPLHFCCKNITRMKKEFFSNLEEIQNTSVHWAIAKHLLVYGADCNVRDASDQSCLDIAESCPALKDLLTKPLNLDEVALVFPWTSISMRYNHILAKVARRQECKFVGSFWFHQDKIEEGSFGLVFAGLNEKDGREVAIKRMEKLKRPEADKKEVSNLTLLADCEQVVTYLSFSEDEHFSYIILELMEGNLDDYLSSAFDVNRSITLCGDVVKGLKYLHEQNILHRDLKPTNILFKTYPKLCFKIADFGLSRQIVSTSTTTSGSIAGTRCWIAPEVLKIPNQKHSMASDVFSCGLVLHYVLSVKRHPFSPVDHAKKSKLQVSHETEANLRNNNPEGWDNSLCPEATDLVKGMLNSDDSKRRKAAEAIAHPLFWSEKKKMDLLIAVGNQPEFQCKRGKRTSPLTEVEKDLDKGFRSKVTHATWNDPAYTHMPFIYKEMETWRKYDTKSVVELVRFIRNSHEHVSDDKRPVLFRKLVLKDFVFLEYFPKLVMEVFNCVKTHGWDTREEIKYVLD